MTQMLRRLKKPRPRVDVDARALRIAQLMKKVQEDQAAAEDAHVNGHMKHNWDEVREFYTNFNGEIDLASVARQFGIPLQSVYRKSSTEDWRELRVHAQAKMLRDRRSERNVETARKAQEFDDRAYETAKLGLNLVTSRMAQIADQFTVQRLQFEQALTRAAAGQPVTKADLWSSINYRELVELGKSLDLFQTVGRRALGTDVQTIAMLMDSDPAGVGDREASIAEELGNPDPDRLAALVDALVDANMMGLTFDESGEITGLSVLEGEVVGETTDTDAEPAQDKLAILAPTGEAPLHGPA